MPMDLLRWYIDEGEESWRGKNGTVAMNPYLSADTERQLCKTCQNLNRDHEGNDSEYKRYITSPEEDTLGTAESCSASLKPAQVSKKIQDDQYRKAAHELAQLRQVATNAFNHDFQCFGDFK